MIFSPEMIVVNTVTTRTRDDRIRPNNVVPLQDSVTAMISLYVMFVPLGPLEMMVSLMVASSVMVSLVASSGMEGPPLVIPLKHQSANENNDNFKTSFNSLIEANL